MKNSYKFKCKTCGNILVKNGKTSTGKQRYKCKYCNNSRVINKAKKQKQNELKLFLKWITDSTKVTDKVNMPRRTFYQKTKWCWDVIPKINLGEYSPRFIYVDATYLHNNTCLLIAADDNFVLNYHWAESENFDDYCELLKPIKEPNFVISDGHKGIIKATKEVWKNIQNQRCLVHISRDSEKRLGKRSPCYINHLFREHINKIHCVDTLRKAQNWLNKFDLLYSTHKDFIEEKTLRKNQPLGATPKYDRTHKRLYSVCNSIKNLAKKNMLFLFLENGFPNNSNRIEGGINSPLKNLERCHRGICLEHQKRMFEWYLLKRSNTPINDFIKSLDFDNLSTRNGN